MTGNPLRDLIANRGKSILTAAAKDVVRAAAPNLGKAIGGPLGRVAEREIARAVAGDADADPTDVSRRIEAGDADTMAALTEAQAKIEAAGVDLARVEAEDRADARDYLAETGDKTTARLAFLIIGAFVFFTAALFFHAPPEASVEIIQGNVKIFEYLVIAIAAFYFGSSIGSKIKTGGLIAARGR